MTSAPKLLDQELAQFGWVESIATNSISDFKSPNVVAKEVTTDPSSLDFINIFICHLIFYIIFCYSLYLYIFIDLSLGLFLKRKLTKLFKYAKKSNIKSIFAPSKLNTESCKN